MMIQKRSQERKGYGTGLSIGLGVACFFLFFSLIHFGPQERLKLTLVNFSFEIRSLILGRHLSPSPDIVILEIDDETLSQEALPELNKWPWPRALLGGLTDKLETAGAKVIAYDLLFNMESSRGKEDDQALVDTFSKYNNVVIGADFEKEIDQGRGIEKERMVPPIELYEKKVRYGYVNYWVDEDKNIRNALLSKEFVGLLWDSFDKAVIEKYNTGLLGDRNFQEPILINFSGPPHTYTSYPVYQVFDEELYKSVLKGGEVFKDKIVLVGPTANYFQDFHPTPYGGGSVLGVASPLLMPGVDIHANSIDTLLQQRELHELPVWLEVLLALGLGATAGLLIWKVGPFVGAFSSLMIWVGYSSLGFLLFTYQNLVPDLALSPLILLGTYTLINGQKYIRAARDKSRYRNLFGLYVPPQLVEALVSNPELQGWLEGEKKEISVMFIDIRGFTSLSGQMDPVTLVQILNEYSQVIGNALKPYEGIIDKFIGDGVMITFNAVAEQPDHAKRAVLSAIEIQNQLNTWLAERRTGVRDLFRFGIGINTGEGIVGNVGTKESTSFTVIGNAVNLAARLEGKAREGNQIIISQTTYDQTRDVVETQFLGEQEIKGFMEPIPIYQVLEKKEYPSVVSRAAELEAIFQESS